MPRRASPAAGTGTTAKVNDLHNRRKQYASAAGLYRRAKIDVLEIEKVALVEEADGFRVGPPRQKASAGHPIHIALTAGLAFDPATRERATAGVRRLHKFAGGLTPGIHRAAHREFWMSMFVNDSWADDGDIGQLVESRDQAIDGAGRHDRIWIQQEEEL